MVVRLLCQPAHPWAFGLNASQCRLVWDAHRSSVGPTSWVASCSVHPLPCPNRGLVSVPESTSHSISNKALFCLFLCVRVSGCQISKLIRRSTDRSCIFFLFSELLAGSLSGQSLWKQVRKHSDWLAVQITTMATRKPQGELWRSCNYSGDTTAPSMGDRLLASSFTIPYEGILSILEVRSVTCLLPDIGFVPEQILQKCLSWVALF